MSIEETCPEIRIVVSAEENDSGHKIIAGPRGSGNASHQYEVIWGPASFYDANGIKFQEGGVEESGANGLHNEDLLHIVKDRLKSFQEGPYQCVENALALQSVEEAIMWLESRTQARRQRGVEGTSQV